MKKIAIWLIESIDSDEWLDFSLVTKNMEEIRDRIKKNGKCFEK